MIGLLLAALFAQAPTGSVSAFVDHFPNRDATELRARIFAEEKADAGPRLRVTASGFVEGLLADRGGKVTDAIVEPQDVSLTVRGKRAELMAGLGRVVWGRLDELQPTDVVNPLDLSRFFFEGRGEARLAVPLVRGTLFASDKASVEAVYVPFFRRARFDRLDEPSSPFNLTAQAAAPVVDRVPARIAANAQGGARVSVTTARVDWSVSAYDGFRPFGLYSLTPEGALERTYARFTMIGADFETAKGAWGARGEVAVFPRDAFQTPAAPAIVQGTSFDAGGAVDRKAGDYRLSGQVLVHRESHAAAPALSEHQRVEGSRTDVSIVASADRAFARQKYETRVFAVYNPGEASGFVRGIAVASLRDNVKLEGSVGWFAGSGEDTISRFADSDFAYVRMKYFF
jgi:Protein of unknown function (DUF1302)